jgi:hypothetical protein
MLEFPADNVERVDAPLTLMSYSFGCRMSSAAASPFRGSFGFGYRSSWGRKTSKMLIMSVCEVSDELDGEPRKLLTEHGGPRLVDDIEADRTAPVTNG